MNNVCDAREGFYFIFIFKFKSPSERFYANGNSEHHQMFDFFCHNLNLQDNSNRRHVYHRLSILLAQSHLLRTEMSTALFFTLGVPVP